MSLHLRRCHLSDQRLRAGEIRRRQNQSSPAQTQPLPQRVVSSLTLSFCAIAAGILRLMDVFTATSEGGHANSMPNHLYCSPLPNYVFIQNIWPLLVAPIRSLTPGNLQSIEYLHVLFHLRSVNSEWKWLVETSTEWAAFRVARAATRLLVGRGTSAQFARRHAIQEYNNALSLFAEPRKLTVSMCHGPLITPFPDLSDRWLIVLKDALQTARDGTMETPNVSDAYSYIPPDVGANMSADRFAVGKRLENLHLGL